VKPELHFSKEARFKIVQFTDIHLRDFEPRARDEPADVMSRRAAGMRASLFATIRRVLDEERPDLVIFTGDNVLVPDHTFERWGELVGPVIERNIPWAAVMGNHDHEFTEKSRHELMTFLGTLPFSLCECGPEELGGGGNYVLPVRAHGSPRIAAALYCMDSGDYAEAQFPGDYAWFSHDTVRWFRNKSQEIALANGGIPLPSLAFFHIPLPEFQEAFSTGHVVGYKNENVCCPKLNSGMFVAMLESGAVRGAFAGHDHNNDCAASFHGILLAYGRKTGDFCYLDLPCGGARVIELEEAGHSFSSWIRTAVNKTENPWRYPDDFSGPPEKNAAPEE
jgi:hypothetical protein